MGFVQVKNGFKSDPFILEYNMIFILLGSNHYYKASNFSSFL